MHLLKNGEIVLETKDPIELLALLAKDLDRPIIVSPREGIAIAILKVLEHREEYSVPHLEFFMFLDEHKVLKTFLEQANYWTTEAFSATVERLELREADFVDSFFTWDTAPEGYKFWDNIDIEWKRYLDAKSRAS